MYVPFRPMLVRSGLRTLDQQIFLKLKHRALGLIFRTTLFPQIRMRNLYKIAHLTRLSTGFACGAIMGSEATARVMLRQWVSDPEK